jgi:hypothetical protein
VIYLIPNSADPLPAALDLSLVKKYLRVYGDEEDDIFLQLFLNAAMLAAEGVNGANQPLFRRKFTAPLSGFTTCRLPGIAPSVTSISYLSAGITTPTDLLETGWSVDGSHLRFVSPFIQGVTSPVCTVTYEAGYSEEAVPEDIKWALLLMIEDRWNNRANPVQERVTAAENLLRTYRHHYLI